ncbi:MAG: ABC transporter substrate-binding protein [Chloroflexota bacterium]|nr:ABC transporter substrate-binding protein [Chloroflexota bacterium]
MTRQLASIIVLTVVALTACGNPGNLAPTTEPAHIRLPMGFVANVQFAPWYVAVERGYFAQEGIELEFDYGDYDTKGVQLVAAGWTPFAIASGDQVLKARAQGMPVVTFVNWWRRFPVAVVALRDSGIKEPSDLEGRKVGIPETFGAASYIGWKALASATDLNEEHVDLEVIGYAALENLTVARVDAAVVYANNEPVQLRQRGYETNLILVADYAPLISNGIITSEQVLADKPELVRAFARAFLRGLEETMNDPDAAFEICKEYVEGLEDNEEMQRAVLEASLGYWRGEPLGHSNPEAWENTVEVMERADILEGNVEPEEAFTNAFLP